MRSKENPFLGRVADLVDEFCLWKMDCLTTIGRRHLPAGYWGGGFDRELRAGPVCLTFDDGPCPHTTPWLLEMLEEAQVTATFFLIGSHAARHGHLVEKIRAGGHVIGNHTFNHHPMPILPTRSIEREIDRANAEIGEITGQSPVLFRPPYGLIDERAAECLRQRQMVSVYWSAVPLDWEAPGARRVAGRVLRRMSAGSLIVLHERRLLAKQTISAAKEIICKGKELGYEFVGIPQLMENA